MNPYRDINGDSGVNGYESGEDFIRVQFKGGSIYLYTYESAGAEAIEQMKRLAISGDGLNAFINKNVKKAYATKEA
jgi:hypothetical protein